MDPKLIPALVLLGGCTQVPFARIDCGTMAEVVARDTLDGGRCDEVSLVMGPLEAGVQGFDAPIGVFAQAGPCPTGGWGLMIERVDAYEDALLVDVFLLSPTGTMVQATSLTNSDRIVVEDRGWDMVTGEVFVREYEDVDARVLGGECW